MKGAVLPSPRLRCNRPPHERGMEGFARIKELTKGEGYRAMDERRAIKTWRTV